VQLQRQYRFVDQQRKDLGSQQNAANIEAQLASESPDIAELDEGVGFLRQEYLNTNEGLARIFRTQSRLFPTVQKPCSNFG
jgi:hypothetical protein